jgi:hypothetical protein
MTIPDGGNSVRQGIFFIAPQITIQVADAPNPSKPVITATLDDNGAVNGPRFTIYDIISVQVDDMTEIKVTAGLLPGLPPNPRRLLLQPHRLRHPALVAPIGHLRQGGRRAGLSTPKITQPTPP